MVTAIGYAYPWDFAGDPGAVRRAVDIGVEGVAVVAAYHNALCPAAQDVREYCANLVGEIVEQAHPDGLILEACGPLGVDHGGHHDKLEFAGWTKAQRDLLSLCFCVACQDLYRDTGIEP